MWKESKVQLGIEEIVTLCYIVGASTNGICQFASDLSALRPDLHIFLPRLKTKLVGFEGGGNLDHETELHALIVNKDGTPQ